MQNVYYKKETSGLGVRTTNLERQTCKCKNYSINMLNTKASLYTNCQRDIKHGIPEELRDGLQEMWLGKWVPNSKQRFPARGAQRTLRHQVVAKT